MNALIQYKGNAAYSLPAAIQAEGFRQRGYHLIPFTVDELGTRTWEREDVVVGGVGSIRHIFDRMGIPWNPVSYPEELNPFLKRKVEIKKLKGLIPSDLPAFLKPVEDSKAFTGFVCEDIHDRRLGNLPLEMRVYVAEPLELLTEYRVYVLAGKILNICRYNGPVDHFPHPQTIREMIRAYTQAPIAYSLDVGVIISGETVLVETNEALSLGNYGLSPVLAAKMTSARWNQIMGLDYRDDAECGDSPNFVSVY